MMHALLEEAVEHALELLKQATKHAAEQQCSQALEAGFKTGFEPQPPLQTDASYMALGFCHKALMAGEAKDDLRGRVRRDDVGDGDNGDDDDSDNDGA
eukprot:1160277-Pelagomonas_calceolata.AAC.19